LGYTATEKLLCVKALLFAVPSAGLFGYLNPLTMNVIMQIVDLLVLIFVLFLGGAMTIGVLWWFADIIAEAQDAEIRSRQRR
jgi:hypothetical protein